MRPAAVILLLVLAGACAAPEPVPAPGFAARGGGDFPRLLPLETFDLPAGMPPAQTARENGLEDRAARLRARAASLAGPVLSAAERRRLLAARARLGG